MTASTRILVSLCFLLCLVCGFPRATADPPQKGHRSDTENENGVSSPRFRTLELPDIEIPAVPASSENSADDNSSASRIIRDAVDGKASKGSVNDPILDDVLQIIRHRKDRLNLSLLDPDQVIQTSGTMPGELARSTKNSSSVRARAAEQLLRASRLLLRAGENSPELDDLVNRMRAEAVSLLTD